jgi:hypothetical protein|tara:strand:+ start:155 stop:418 length:264 start_codon:yes stop_codon:yes gene_type:complete
MISFRPLGLRILGVNVIGNRSIDPFPGESVIELEGLWKSARTKYKAGNQEEGYAEMEACVVSIGLRHGKKARKLYNHWSNYHDQLPD